MSGFVHRAFLYRHVDEWVGGLLPFVREGVDRDEPVLVVVADERIPLLRSALGETNGSIVEFAPMGAIGKNPGRIISAWHDFVDRHPGRRLRGIGEPIWPGRRPDEMVECQHHEQLLNLAFDGCDFELLCPYDITGLSDDVVIEAVRSHPYLDGDEPNEEFVLDVTPAGVLPSPPDGAITISLSFDNLRAVRHLVHAQACRLIADPRRVDDLVLAVSEAATNSIEHGTGGVLAVWSEADRLVCQISNVGQLPHPLVGRRRPPPEAPRGRGVWMAHQMCDLVQIRSAEQSTTVRLAMELTSAPA